PQGEIGDRQEPSWNTSEVERPKVTPDGGVRGQVGTEREEHWDSGRKAEEDRQLAPVGAQGDQARERECRQEPTEVDELLAPRCVPAVGEVGPFSRVAPYLADRAAALLGRMRDERV